MDLVENGTNGQNGSGGQNGHAGRRGFNAGTLLCAALLVGAACYAWFALMPFFQSPSSRVYSSWLGYPSVMRLLDRPIEVNVTEVRARSMVKTVSAEGSLGYLNEVPVEAEVAGIVTEVLVEPGQEVRKGDVLLRLNTGWHFAHQDELQVRLAEWVHKEARVNYDRLRKLATKRAASQLELELAAVAVKRAETALALAKEEYDNSLRSRSESVAGKRPPGVPGGPPGRDIEVVAVTGGTVFERSVRLGQHLVRPTAVPTGPLFLIGDRLTFVAAFDQRYASSVRVGDKGKFHLRAYPGETFEGEVVRVAHSVAPENAPRATPGNAPRSSRGGSPWVQPQPPDTFLAWVSVPREARPAGGDRARGGPAGRHPVSGGKKLITGMNGYCLFERPFSAPAVPESALMRYSGRTGTVLVVDPSDRVEVRAVTYTGTDDGWVAIDGGLREGERVVTEGQLGLRAGDKVWARGD